MSVSWWDRSIRSTTSQTMDVSKEEPVLGLHFDLFPTEIQYAIICLLPYKALVSGMRVSSSWNRTIRRNQSLWRSQMCKVFTSQPEPMRAEACWHSLFRAVYMTYKQCVTHAAEITAAFELGHHLWIKKVVMEDPFLIDEHLLFEASQAGMLDIMLIALKHHVSPNLIWHGSGGFSSLYIAAKFGHTQAARLLITYGANVEFKFKNEYTPLYMASIAGFDETVRLLLAFGANAESACNAGSTSLYVASQNGHHNVVTALLEHGASTKVRFERMSCFYISVRNNHPEVLQRLMSSPDRGAPAEWNEPDKYGATPLYVAAQTGAIESARILIDAGANIESVSYKECKPLYVSSSSNQLESIKLLYEYGVDINAVSGSFGRAGLHIAAERNHIEAAKLLLQYGAQVDLPSSSDLFETALSIAAYKGHTEMMQLLIDHGAEIDRITDNRTILATACINGDLEIASRLYSFGASIGSVNGSEPPLHVAIRNGSKNAVKFLISKGACTFGCMNIPCRSDMKQYLVSMLGPVPVRVR